MKPEYPDTHLATTGNIREASHDASLLAVVVVAIGAVVVVVAAPVAAVAECVVVVVASPHAASANNSARPGRRRTVASVRGEGLQSGGLGQGPPLWALA